MSERTSIDDPAWEPTLRAALRRGARPKADHSFFLEFREDLVVHCDGEAPPRVTRTRRSGLALRDGTRLIYGPDPVPDDARRIADEAREGRIARVRPDPTGDGGDAPACWIPEAPWVERGTRLVAPQGAAEPRMSVQIVLSEQHVMTVRPDQPASRDRRRGGRIRIECRAAGDGLPGAAVGEIALPGGARWDGPRVASLAADVSRRAERRRGAIEPRTEPRSFVFAPGVAGILAHELIGHALEGDTVLRGHSWLAASDGAGRHAGARELTVIDDPRRARVAWRVDDEGVEARPTVLIRDGAVAGMLLDRVRARTTRARSTGHGRCASFRDPALPRMGCTFIAPGRLEPGEVIAGVRDGVYVRRMEAGSTDPRSGRAVLRVTDSDRIEDGRVGEPLRLHVLVIEGRSMLASSIRIAHDLAFDTCIGGCHRDGQPLATSVGAPTMCIGVVGRLI